MKRIQIEVTNKCNMNCIYCPRASMTRAQGFMDLELYKKIIMQYAAMGGSDVYLFWLGEPLLHPQLSEMIKFAKACNCSPIIQTNGALLTQEKIIELEAAAPACIGFSIDGAWDYEKYRGQSYPEVFGRVLECIDYFKYKQSRTAFCLTTLQIHANRKLVAEYYAAICQRINRVPNFIPLAVQKGGEMIVDGVKVKTDKMPDGYKNCKDGRTHVVVGWDGRATFCCADYDIKNCIGDLKTETLAGIWDKLRTGIHKDLDAQKFAEIEACKECVWARGSEVSK